MKRKKEPARSKSFTGKIAVVTGASSGIGLAVTTRLASEGAMVILIGRDAVKLRHVAKKIQMRFHGKALSYSCDITDTTQLQQTISQVKHDVKKIDYLVNCAGGSHITAETDLFDSAFDTDINLNLRGTHLCCRLFASMMRRGGAMVNVSSLAGQQVFYPLYGKNSIKMGYAAAKAAVIQLTRAYAVELSQHDIRVNAVAPGVIYPTGMTDNWPKEKQKDVIANIPLRRLGTPQDIANAIRFLLSDEASFITGHTISVNGGRFM